MIANKTKSFSMVRLAKENTEQNRDKIDYEIDILANLIIDTYMEKKNKTKKEENYEPSGNIL